MVEHGRYSHSRWSHPLPALPKDGPRYTCWCCGSLRCFCRHYCLTGLCSPCRKVLPYLGVERKTQTAKTREAAVPNVGNLTVEQATTSCSRPNFTWRLLVREQESLGRYLRQRLGWMRSLVYIYTDIDDNQVATDNKSIWCLNKPD